MATDTPITASATQLEAVPVLFLWMNTRCNARCVMCEIWRERSSKRLSADQIRKWAPGWARFGVRDVQLCGEATLHPELWDICSALTYTGIRVHFLTNGLRLSEFADRFAGFASTVTVSLDGPPDVHDRIRGVGRAYERLARGVADLRSTAPKMPIFGRCAVHRLNFQHLSATISTARELGLTTISFFGLDVGTNAFGREGLSAVDRARVRDLALDLDEVHSLAGDLDRLAIDRAADFACGFVRESPEQLDRALVQHFKALATGSLPPAVRCNAPWTSVVVEPDGAVRPCFFFPAHGNLHTEPLVAIVNGQAARRFRATLDTAVNAVCRVCVCPQYREPHGGTRE